MVDLLSNKYGISYWIGIVVIIQYKIIVEKI